MSSPRVGDFEVLNLLTQYRESNPPDDLFFATEAGHALVEAHLGNGRTDLDEDELRIVELWASAHFAMATSSDLQAKKTDTRSEAFARSAPTMGMTKYLKQAILLDRSGKLAQAQKQNASITLISR